MHAKLATLALFVLAGSLWQDPEAVEPKRQLEVVVDGVAHRLGDGGEVAVKVGDREVKLLARVLPTRRFAAAGIAFEYPTNMAFEFEADEPMRSWTFDGNNVVLTVQHFGELEAEEIAKEVVANLGAQLDADTPSVDRKLDLGGKEHTARCLEVAIAGNVVCYRVVPVVSPKGGVLLMLQDSATLDRPSDELKAVLDLLAKTFVAAAK